jgi:hypothetical protein
MVRRLLVLLVCAASAAVAQEAIKIKSEPLLLRPKRDVRSVKITITEPQPTQPGMTIVRSGLVMMKGVVSPGDRLRSLAINGRQAVCDPKGSFSALLQLRPGMNDVVVSGQDSLGNAGTEHAAIIYDSGPPTIEIIEPRLVDMRGIRAMPLETSTIRGKVYDDSGIQRLTADGENVPIYADSSFSVQKKFSGPMDSVLILAVDYSGLSSQKMVLLTRKRNPAKPEFLTGKSYGLIIGIDGYSGAWPRLKNAVRDAKAVEEILRSDFLFDKLYTLYDGEATRQKILGTLEYLVRNLKPEDNLMIYYSGHGVKEKPFNRGFWVPADATERTFAGYISNGDIQLMLDAQSPRHVLLVADACFAGDIFKGSTEMVPFDNNADYYSKIASRKSRKALTSGGEEPVMDGGKDDHSVFAYYFLRALKNIKGGYFDAGQVFNELRIPVTNNSEQVPEFAPIKNTGDEGGQFIFVRRQNN